MARQQLWMNPLDAEPRGIADGDTVAVKSPAGEIRIEAKVTPRIVPRHHRHPAGRVAQRRHGRATAWTRARA